VDVTHGGANIAKESEARICVRRADGGAKRHR
jgi:hypothetical protein